MIRKVNIRELIYSTQAFTQVAHDLFSSIDSAGQSRTVKLENTYNKLNFMNFVQDDILRQAIRCTEHGLYRSAHVMAWSAAIDFLQEYAMQSSRINSIAKVRPKWNVVDVDDLKEKIGDFAIIEAMRDANLIRRRQSKAFFGLLSKRNECAHPTGYYPDLDQTLGYISEIIYRLSQLNP